ncbi:hypothetical protein T09_6839 [Trichinella sp. T9]|nr:hypothetical protein T09_6839 [Trichinella sp. T9]
MYNSNVELTRIALNWLAAIKGKGQSDWALASQRSGKSLGLADAGTMRKQRQNFTHNFAQLMDFHVSPVNTLFYPNTMSSRIKVES